MVQTTLTNAISHIMRNHKTRAPNAIAKCPQASQSICTASRVAGSRKHDKSIGNRLRPHLHLGAPPPAPPVRSSRKSASGAAHLLPPVGPDTWPCHSRFADTREPQIANVICKPACWPGNARLGEFGLDSFKAKHVIPLFHKLYSPNYRIS